ncbi:c-type cytochrome [Woeseia oceani]|nr:c-type cytochrome [Woeseia oceani]
MNIVNRYAALAAAVLAFSALAPMTAHADGNPEQGEQLAYTCMGCHGIPGYRNAYPSYRVPKLGGQKAAYIETALKAYRDGNRPHPTMQAQGESLSDQDIADVAAYFQGAEMATDSVTADDIAGLDAAKTCLTCHGAQSAGMVPTPATLSGQHQDYLMHALDQYKSGARAGTVMSAFAGMLSDDDIEAIARFYSRRDDGVHTPEKSD